MKLTTEQVQDAVDMEVDRIEGEGRRWSRTNTSIFKGEDGKFYSVYWEQGLTECQENEYEEQEAIEVECVEETVIIKKWISVKDKEKE